MKIKLVLSSDQLDKEDLRALIQAIRACEITTFPQKEISIKVEAPDLSMDDMSEILRSIKPPYKRGPFTFKRSGLGAEWKPGG